MASKTGDAANEMQEQAAERVGAMADQAKKTLDAASAAAQQATSTIGDASDAAWNLARKTSAQASGIAEDMLQQGQQAARVVQSQVEQQPWMALLAAGALGFTMGYLMRGGR
jgi:ElaB/YqjD/DUF883 family membrane-anchored ribosome-binding protein